MKKVLIVEDEKHLADGLMFNIKQLGHESKHAENGKEALELLESYRPDLLILDLMMPVMDGFSTIEEIRKTDQRTPILILSAKDAREDIVRCFKKGVDDYLTKPFNLDELILRVERMLTRVEWYEDTPNELCQIGKWTIDFDKLVAKNDEKSQGLTSQEVDLLKYFLANAGRALTRQEIMENALGYAEQISSRTIDNFVVRFRKYFEEDPKTPKHFKSIRSIGYVFEKDV